MAKKIYLNVRSEPATFTLFGISCHLKDYRLSYLLNKQLGFSFTKRDDLSFPGVTLGEKTEFSFYLYRNEERFTTFYLIANRSQDFILVPELKQFDFLLLIEGKFVKAEKEQLDRNIRQLPGILTVFENKLSEIKNSETLLSDIEMHVMNILKTPNPQYQPKPI